MSLTFTPQSHTPIHYGEEFVLVNSDLKTIEPVINAWISNCKKAKDVFLLGCREPDNPNGDWYSNVGASFMKQTPEYIRKNTNGIRDVVKNDVVLALNYGRNPQILADVLGWTFEETEAAYKKFFYEDFPEMHVSYEQIRYQVFMGQPVRDVTGGQQLFPLHNLYDYDRDKHFWLLPHELEKVLKISAKDRHIINKAGNFRIQGPSTKINTLGNININKRRMMDPEFRRLVHTHNMVHDSQVMSFMKKYFQWIVNETASIIYDCKTLAARGWGFNFTEDENPLRGEYKAGLNYWDMKEVFYGTN